MPPPIALFLTTIASQPTLRRKQEYILRILQTKKIPYTSYDLASDEAAKRLWKRKAPPDKQQLPGILIGGTFPGTFDQFEEAVEYAELDTFLRRNEPWNEDEDAPVPEQKPIGVPGAVTPLAMTPERIRNKIIASQQHPSPLGKVVAVNKRAGDIDVGEELSGYGLQGLKVSEDELADLIAELGLEGDEAGDLVKGLSGGSPSPPPKINLPKTEAVVPLDADQESAKETETEAEVETKKVEKVDVSKVSDGDTTQ